MPQQIPILFACSGCSHAGQIANDVAQELDARGIAEMSCLAGVGAAKRYFLKQLPGREVWVIDGCPIECGLGVFGQVSEHVDVHIRLHELGVRKKAERPTGPDFARLVEAVLDQVLDKKQASRLDDECELNR